MKPKELEHWKATRLKGRTKYVLVNGVLSYGLSMFIAMTFFINQTPTKVLTINYIIVQLLIWSAAGFIFGTAMWYFQEKRYRKANE